MGRVTRWNAEQVGMTGMLNRRSLIGAIASAPVTAPEIAKAALGEIGGSMVGEPDIGCGGIASCDPCPTRSWEVIDRVRERGDSEARAMMGQISPAIATKRSWSVAFKAHCHAQDEIEVRKLREELHENRQLVEVMAKALGIWRGA